MNCKFSSDFALSGNLSRILHSFVSSNEYPYCAMVKVFARPAGRPACLRFCVSAVANWVWSCDRINLAPDFMEIDTNWARAGRDISVADFMNDHYMASQLYWLTYLLTVLFWRGIRRRFARKYNNNIKEIHTTSSDINALHFHVSSNLSQCTGTRARARNSAGCVSIAAGIELGQLECGGPWHAFRRA